MPKPRALRAGDLRKNLAAEKLEWIVAEHLADTAAVPIFGIGADTAGLVPAAKAKAVNFKAILKVPPINPFLIQRAVEHKFIPQPKIPVSPDRPHPIGKPDIGPLPIPAPVGAPLAGGPAASVDWRNRWGWPWITSVRNQNGCESCWAFAATALTEAMVRIEHCFWPHYSEGDVHKGMGAKCANGGSCDAAVDWIHAHGLCDPQCFPWTTADIAYNPTSDRSGRTVRGTLTKTDVGSIADQKTWIDTIGPLATWFDVWHDFDGYGSGVYKRSTASWNYERGGHFMLVVGYNDALGAWLCKNSWSTSFGMNGYVWVGYGQSGIDDYAKIGLRGMNPDPWTKRRIHSGNMIESGNGAHYRNFEMLATVGGGPHIQHWWRDNDTGSFPWHTAYAPFGNDAAVCPTLTGTTYNRNFECVFLTTGSRLHHWWFDEVSKTWNDGGVFGPPDAWGVPGFIQGNYGAPGNFEVVVRTKDGRLNHWWRMNGAAVDVVGRGQVRRQRRVQRALADPEPLRHAGQPRARVRAQHRPDAALLAGRRPRRGLERRRDLRPRLHERALHDRGAVRSDVGERTSGTSSCASPSAARCSTGGATTTATGSGTRAPRSATTSRRSPRSSRGASASTSR